MTLHRLADLDDWTLEDDDQDIRERPLMGPEERPLGIVKDFMVDLERERVAAVVTDAGESYAAEVLEIRPDKVIAHGPPLSGATASREGYTGRIRRRG